MKKLLLPIMLGVVMATNAQETQNTNFNTNARFGDDISLGAEGAIQTNLNTWKKSNGGVFGINLNKDFTPYFGMSIEAFLGGDNTANWFADPATKKVGHGLDNVSGFLTGRWNVLNSLGGFRGHRRIFEVETNVGVGYGRFYEREKGVADWNALQVKTGLNLNFYVNEERSVSINVRPACIWNVSQTGKFDSRYAVAQLGLGLTYNFKTSNGTHYFVKNDNRDLQAEIEALTLLNAELQAKLDERSEPAEVVVEKVVEKVVEEVKVPTYLENTFLINFAFNSSELVGDAKATLDKIPAGSNVTIAGYASPEGNKAYNLKLSDRRAEAVKNYLLSRGVNVEKTVGYGADNEEANRIVIVTLK